MIKIMSTQFLKEAPFEESLKELQVIVERLENGDSRLEDLLSNYKQGIKLVSHCRKLLDSAECSVKELQTKKDQNEK
jgi:exodeoxyribonuclease VII small subunit